MRILAFALLVATAALPPPSSAQKTGAVIRPGEVWLDTQGHPIEAHGGGVTRVGKEFFWYGEDRRAGNDPKKRYVSCYSSTDLAHWTYRGQPLVLSNPDGLGDAFILERPKVYYNAKTKKFVMYFHLDATTGERRYGYARVGVAVSDKPDGPFMYVKSFRPLGQESRDIGQFVDDDGAAYLIFESRPTGGFFIARLTDDFMDVKEETAFIKAPLEGGALVHYGGMYYVVGSHLSGWKANPNVYATAKSLAGPWSEMRDVAPKETNTWESQSAYILKVTGTKGAVVIYMGDRWKPSELTDSRYVWMPMKIDGGEMALPEPKPWVIDVKTGVAKVQ